MGSGKTTIGKELSKRLKIEFIDLDSIIEEKTGIKIENIFKLYGQKGFRRIERKTLEELVKNTKKPVVLSLGGGTVVCNENLRLLKNFGDIFFLDVSFKEALKRVSKDNKKRPVLESKNEDDKKDLFLYRKKIYKECSKFIVNADKNKEEIIKNLLTHSTFKNI